MKLKIPKKLPNKNENPVLKAGLEYHNRGWCIIPIPYGQKKAAIEWKQYQTSRPDENQLVQWFGNHKANIGLMLGAISGGLTCLDFDELGKYEQWKQAYPQFADRLPTVQTARGMHVYFRSTRTKTKKLDGLDIKASGYCMLPPSLHPDGKTFYRWLIEPNGELIELSLKDLGIEDFTEETEESEDIEDIEAIKGVSSLSSVNDSVIVFENLDVKVKNYVNTAIKCTLPDKEGYRNFLFFQFCRWLKGHAEFEKCKAGQLKLVIKLWHEKALPIIGTKPFDETWADFCYGWTRVKYPKGKGELKIAVEKALNAQKNLTAEELYEIAEVKLLIRVCYELQALRKTESFWLSWGDAALILGVSVPTAGKWLSMLEADGIIKMTEGHTTKRATRYKFIAN